MIGMHTLIPLCFIKAISPESVEPLPELIKPLPELVEGKSAKTAQPLRKAQGTVSVSALMYFLFKNNFVKTY